MSIIIIIMAIVRNVIVMCNIILIESSMAERL